MDRVYSYRLLIIITACRFSTSSFEFSFPFFNKESIAKTALKLKTLVFKEHDQVHVLMKLFNNAQIVHKPKRSYLFDNINDFVDYLRYIHRYVHNTLVKSSYIIADIISQLPISLFLLLLIITVFYVYFDYAYQYYLTYIKEVKEQSETESESDIEIEVVPETISSTFQSQKELIPDSILMMLENEERSQIEMEHQLELEMMNAENVKRHQQQQLKYQQTLEHCRMVIEDLLSHEIRQKFIDQEYHFSLQEATCFPPVHSVQTHAPDFSHDEVYAKLLAKYPSSSGGGSASSSSVKYLHDDKSVNSTMDDSHWNLPQSLKLQYLNSDADDDMHHAWTGPIHSSTKDLKSFYKTVHFDSCSSTRRSSFAVTALKSSSACLLSEEAFTAVSSSVDSSSSAASDATDSEDTAFSLSPPPSLSDSSFTLHTPAAAGRTHQPFIASSGGVGLNVSVVPVTICLARETAGGTGKFVLRRQSANLKRLPSQCAYQFTYYTQDDVQKSLTIRCSDIAACQPHVNRSLLSALTIDPITSSMLQNAEVSRRVMTLSVKNNDSSSDNDGDSVSDIIVIFDGSEVCDKVLESVAEDAQHSHTHKSSTQLNTPNHVIPTTQALSPHPLPADLTAAQILKLEEERETLQSAMKDCKREVSKYETENVTLTGRCQALETALHQATERQTAAVSDVDRKLKQAERMKNASEEDIAAMQKIIAIAQEEIVAANRTIDSLIEQLNAESALAMDTVAKSELRQQQLQTHYKAIVDELKQQIESSVIPQQRELSQVRSQLDQQLAVNSDVSSELKLYMDKCQELNSKYSRMLTLHEAARQESDHTRMQLLQAEAELTVLKTPRLLQKQQESSPASAADPSLQAYYQATALCSQQLLEAEEALLIENTSVNAHAAPPAVTVTTTTMTSSGHSHISTASSTAAAAVSSPYYTSSLDTSTHTHTHSHTKESIVSEVDAFAHEMQSVVSQQIVVTAASAATPTVTAAAVAVITNAGSSSTKDRGNHLMLTVNTATDASTPVAATAVKYHQSPSTNSATAVQPLLPLQQQQQQRHYYPEPPRLSPSQHAAASPHSSYVRRHALTAHQPLSDGRKQSIVIAANQPPVMRKSVVSSPVNAHAHTPSSAGHQQQRVSSMLRPSDDEVWGKHTPREAKPLGGTHSTTSSSSSSRKTPTATPLISASLSRFLRPPN